jgi:hypothetical protein
MSEDGNNATAFWTVLAVIVGNAAVMVGIAQLPEGRRFICENPNVLCERRNDTKMFTMDYINGTKTSLTNFQPVGWQYLTNRYIQMVDKPEDCGLSNFLLYRQSCGDGENSRDQ